jgi:RNA-directed DNA polymerase
MPVERRDTQEDGFAMNMKHEDNPSPVPETATQDGDIWFRWNWVERAAWTERMLTALEVGVKGNVWFSLIDKVTSERNLNAAAVKVIANKGAAGVDHVSVEQFERDLVKNVKHLSGQLREGSYRPQAVRRVHIPKPGSVETRPLGIPTVKDRATQGAVRQVIEPIFEHEFAEHSYGFRPGRGCKDALRRVDELLKSGHVYVVDADLKSYFDTIPHKPLMRRVGERIADKRVLSLVESFLTAGIMDGLKEWTPEAGAPQGAVLSPLLSNIYLNPLDHQMANGGFEMVRYADDFVILCRSAEEAQQALMLVQQWVTENGLTLHPTKTRIVDTRVESFDFLGYRFERSKRFPRPKSLQKLKDTIRRKTKRANGQSLPVIIAGLTPTLRGWFTYFQHCHKYTFSRLDGWIRGRLRSILRKRRGLRGRGRGADHQRWPNAYFTKLGLFNLEDAHAEACQSSRR